MKHSKWYWFCYIYVCAVAALILAVVIVYFMGQADAMLLARVGIVAPFGLWWGIHQLRKEKAKEVSK